MQCKTCGREISDTAKFCPYCGSKTEPPHNSAENKTAETAYETTANTNAETAYGTETNKNAETAYGTEANKNSETAYGTEANKNSETAYGTKTSKTPETDRETFKNNTEDRFHSASLWLSAIYSQAFRIFLTASSCKVWEIFLTWYVMQE